MALVVNMFAGPGTGKSTNTALIFGKLKQQGVNCEIAHEFAKDLTWEERKNALLYQPYVIGKQMWKVERLQKKVDVIVTDSPIIFGLIYREPHIPASFDQFVVDTFKKWDTFNIFLKRMPEYHKFNPAGRSQTESEAKELDQIIYDLLKHNDIDFTSVDADEFASDYITALIHCRLNKDAR